MAGGTLKVVESGSGSTAADLKCWERPRRSTSKGTPTQVIDGATTTELTFGADDTLQDVADKINELNMGVTANIVRSGSGTTPYRLVVVQRSRRERPEKCCSTRLEIGPVSFQELAAAQDAVLQVGSSDVPGAGILATSSTNQFSDMSWRASS